MLKDALVWEEVDVLLVQRDSYMSVTFSSWRLFSFRDYYSFPFLDIAIDCLERRRRKEIQEGRKCIYTRVSLSKANRVEFYDYDYLLHSLSPSVLPLKQSLKGSCM